MADHNLPLATSSTTDGTPVAPPSAPPSRPKSPLRWLVPLALFFLIIGGIAWLVQNMPTWRTRSQDAPPTMPKGPEILIRFLHPYDNADRVFFALWERPPAKPPKDQAPRLYAREFERGAAGRYYFPFQVHAEQGSEFGVSHKSCDCAELHVAVVPDADGDRFAKDMMENAAVEPPISPSWNWQSLKKTETQGVSLGAGKRAILRVDFTNRRPPGENLNLRNRVWVRSAVTGQKQEFDVKISAVSTNPLRTKRDRVDVGIIQPGSFSKAAFLVWSPTRDEVKFALQEKNNDKLFKIDVVPRDPAACAELQAQLRQEDIMTRVRAAWDVTVTVYESKGGVQFDQGYFLRSLGYDLPDAADDIPPLIITGLVHSDDIRIGGVADQGKINLKSFPAQDGTRKAISVSTNRDIELDPQNVSVHPASLRVKVTEKTKDKAGNKRNWTLEVEVPPNQLFGTISEDSAVILRTKATPPRLIRIPLVGHAVQG